MKSVRKAVFPVGGRGTRLYPATRAVPKELLPVVDRPLIEYAVEEASAAGIEEFLFVTSPDKPAIRTHLEGHNQHEGPTRLRDSDNELLPSMGAVGNKGRFTYVPQMEALGLGHAVWTARHFIGNEPFAVLLADDLVAGQPNALSEIAGAHAAHGGNVVALIEVDAADTSRYGIVSPGSDNGKTVEVLDLVEKPNPADAPSNLAIVGRYILQPAVLDFLALGHHGTDNEIQLTDSMRRLIGQAPFNGVRLAGRWYDCSTKLGLVEANIAHALGRVDLGPNVAARLQAAIDAGPVT